MRLSLKAKLTALISFLVWTVVLAISTLYLSSLTRQALAEVEGRGQYVANEIYHQARTVLAEGHMPPGSDPGDPMELRRFVQATLADNRGLKSLIESAIGYAPTIYYVTITDSTQVVMIHNDPDEVGRVLVPAPPFERLVRAGLISQLQVIYGPPRQYELTLPLDMGGRPLGDIRVGVSTLFLRSQVTPELRTALILSGLAILLATVSAGLLSFRLLRPLETISQSVEQMTRGEFITQLRLDRKDEWGVLSSRLNLLGEQIRGEKAAFVALKENLDQLLADLTDGLMLFDKQDRLVLATPAVSRFLNRPLDSVKPLHAQDVFAADTGLDHLLREAFRTRRSLPWQLVETGGESEIPRVIASIQFIEAEGERVGSLVTLRDATTRAELHKEIDVTTRLAAMGRLTSGVAHEVRNPLNAMVLQLELLKSKLQDKGEQVKPQLEILSAEIRRLDRVVKTFLDFTRPMEIRPAETNLPALIREVFTLAEPQARQNGVQLLLEPDGALPPVRVDRDLVKQALLNLVLNGCQAMPSGGELKVKHQAFPRHIELEITDQGVGIPPEAQKSIFSLYYSTKPGGSGVGLAMAYRIIQLHNGSIDFSSQVNQGTTFRVSLPR
jgi:signal transduction histidine kinase/HAMP domain-containing protein